MAESCIVCLGDLRASHDDTSPPSSPRSQSSASSAHRLKNASTAIHSDDEDNERIAHLLPCQHDLHNACLKPWVERANSCPICRAIFNQVELKDYVDGPTLSSYAVQDKQQQAEIDPTLVIEDDVVELDEPCLICGTVNNAYEVMFCDGCDRMVHVFCAGSQEAPDVWYCTECIQTLDTDGVLPLASATQNRPTLTRRARAERATGRRRARRPNSDWARVWQSVWDNLNFDLDFPFDEEAPETRRTPAQRRDFNAWQRRLRVANRQAGPNRFQETASALLQRPQSDPESQEELRAWNAFDKARELQHDDTASSNRRKRKATTESPASPRENESTPKRILKRPRTRRIVPPAESAAQAESSNQAASRPEGPSFLTSLLKEVERQPPQSDQTSSLSLAVDDQTSAPMSSPEGSPLTSGQGSPRAGSITPPPLMLPRPSYTPLTSTIQPSGSPQLGAYSPFSPTDLDVPQITNQQGQKKPAWHRSAHRREQSPHTSPQSPTTSLSFSTKAEIQRMVKTALKPRYKDSEIDKDQYTDINRDVSRMLYDQVDDASDLADYDSRIRLQKIASDEVQRAIDALKS